MSVEGPADKAHTRDRVQLPKQFGRYRLRRQLGRGRVGVVVEAVDTTLKRRVALKLVRVPEGESGKAVRRRTLEEARRAAGLAHPGIVQVFDVGRSKEAEGWVFIAMEVMSGGDLAKRVEADGVMGVQEACRLVQQAAEGLAIGHAQGVVHRDVKPANLMLSGHGRCKVADFGIAAMEAELEQLERGGKKEAAGTPNYMSPEAARGEVSTAGDAWGLLATLWFVLTGEPPFALERAEDAARVHRGIGLKSLEALRQGLPGVLVELLERGLGEDVAARPGDAAAVARALDAVVVPEAKLKERVPRRSRAVSRRGGGLRWVVGAVVLAVVVGGGLGWWAAQRGGGSDEVAGPPVESVVAGVVEVEPESVEEPPGGDWTAVVGVEGLLAARASSSHPTRVVDRAWDGSRSTVWSSGEMALDGSVSYELDLGASVVRGVPRVDWRTPPGAWGWSVWRGNRGWMEVSPGWRGPGRYWRLEMREPRTTHGVSVREFGLGE
ncbi:MAG: serine/threonine-protein kinase [Planctomycetota bacterium]